MSDGQKMGKTVKGALWLDKEKTTPYDFYQYWINIDDRDVKQCLAFFTFLPMTEVEELGGLQGAEIRKAKEVLAFEATKISHGEEEARKAQGASQSAFGGSGDDDSIPTTSIPESRLSEGLSVIDLFEMAGLISSKSEGRRLVQQGGCYVNEGRIDDISTTIDASHIEDGRIMLRAGKKRRHRVAVT
jgi:tyrosyl-tRNA synthetase